MASTLTQDRVAALLDRPLSTAETGNFDLYLNIAKLRLNGLVCFDVAALGDLPDDLALVWARFFGGITKENTSEDGNVASKRVEDFHITYREGGNDVFGNLVKANQATLAKYGKCESCIRHGRTIFDGEGYHDCV